MASMEVMREYVGQQYSGRWPERVKNMPDYQVAAIYNKMLDDLETVKRRKTDPKLTTAEVRGGVQLSFFENDHTTRIKEGYLK